MTQRTGSRLGLAFAALAALSFVGCGSSSSGDGSGSGGGADSADGFLAQYCQAVGQCCSQLGIGSRDGSACLSLAHAALASGQVRYDATAGQACLAAIQAAESSPSFCSGNDPSGGACKNVLTQCNGTVAPGGVCTGDGDCAAPAGATANCAYQVSSAADGGVTETRYCQVVRPGVAGSTPCVGTVDGDETVYTGGSAAVTDGYLCDRANGLSCGPTGACTALGKLGGTCNATRDCKSGLYCDTGSCAPSITQGGACTSDEQCASGTYCDPKSSTCAAALAVGAACTSSASCSPGLCVKGVCASSSSAGLTLLCGG